MKPSTRATRLAILAKAFAIWLVLICAEILHGIARAIFLVPYLGEFRSNQIGVFTGSVIIVVIALVFVRWIGATRARDLLAVGALWLVLTLGFEIGFGWLVMGLSWERLAADYNVLEGGLLPFGMIVLLFSPLIAGRLSLTEAEHIYDDGAEQVIVGTGLHGVLKLSDEAEAYFKDHDCKVWAVPTPDAVKAWNDAEGMRPN